MPGNRDGPTFQSGLEKLLDTRRQGFGFCGFDVRFQQFPIFGVAPQAGFGKSQRDRRVNLSQCVLEEQIRRLVGTFEMDLRDFFIVAADLERLGGVVNG